MKLIDDRVLEPKLVAFEPRRRPDVSDHIHGTAFTRSSGTAGRGPAAHRCANGLRPTRGRAVRPGSDFQCIWPAGARSTDRFRYRLSQTRTPAVRPLSTPRRRPPPCRVLPI